MTKFCPNCGKKSDANAKFCPYCGQNLTHKKETSKSSISLPTRSSKSRTHDSKRWWILLVSVIILVIGGVFTYKLYENKQQITAVNKMPKKKLADLTIVYTHQHYNNPSWNKVYHQAMNGNLMVQRHTHYNLNGVNIAAQKGHYIYVINNKVVFSTNKNKANSDSTLTISDGKKVLGTVNPVTAYKEVKKKNWNEFQRVDNIKSFNSNFSIRQLAIFAALSHSADIEQDVNFNYKNNTQDLKYEKGYYILQLGGDGVSQTQFKLNGDELIIKYLDPIGAKDNADAPQKTIHVTVSDLAEKYYQTSEQKAYVDKLAKKLVTQEI